MKTKLFVRGLPWETTEAQLEEMFSQYGPIQELKLVMDRDTGRSRGFSFITYATQAGAEAAIKNLDGVEMNFRVLGVSWAEDKPKPAHRGRRR